MFYRKSDKDERAVAIENSSFSLAYKLMAFAILIDVVYRSIVLKQAAWDLLGIVILGGLAATIYQTRFRINNRSWYKAAALSFLGAAVIAVVVVLTR